MSVECGFGEHKGTYCKYGVHRVGGKPKKPGESLSKGEIFGLTDVLYRAGFKELVTMNPDGTETIPDWVKELFIQAGETEAFKSINEIMKLPPDQRDDYIDMHILKAVLKREAT